MAIFVTGGSGFLGGKLIDAFQGSEEVRALARSDAAIAAVEKRGAKGVRGDLDTVEQAIDSLRGCRVLFHCAALAKDWGEEAEFQKANVEGTRKVLAAAKAAGIGRVVHVSTEAIFASGNPLVQLNESSPRPSKPIGFYAQTKGQAEDVVHEAVKAGQEVVIVRPRMIWGKGDTTLVPAIAETVKSGQFAWVGGGTHLTSTTHWKNVIEGLRLAAERGKAGETYFLADDEGPIEFRTFLTQLLEANGVNPGNKTMPLFIAWMAAGGAEQFAKLRKKPPPFTRFALAISAVEVTVDISKAQKELGYRSVITRAQGLAEIKAG